MEKPSSQRDGDRFCSLREAFMNILLNYVNSRGTMLLSLLNASGGDKLVVELRGLRRYFNGECGYERFDDLYVDLRKITSVLELNGGYVELHDEHIVVTRSLLDNLVKHCKK